MSFNITIIFVAENEKPGEIYERFGEQLFDRLPADQQKFKDLLQRDHVIGEKAITKINKPNQSRRGCTAAILQEFDGFSPSNFPDEKFYNLLSVMEEYNNGLEKLAQRIKCHLDPGIYA